MQKKSKLLHKTLRLCCQASFDILEHQSDYTQVHRHRDRGKQEPEHRGLLRQNLDHPGLTFLWLRRSRPAFACRAACLAPPTWPSTRSSPFSISGSAGHRQSHSLALTNLHCNTLFPRPVAVLLSCEPNPRLTEIGQMSLIVSS